MAHGRLRVSFPLDFEVFFNEHQRDHAIDHRRLGPGILETAYRACLAYELRRREFEVQAEEPIPVVYDDVKLDCGFRADLLVRRLVDGIHRIVNNYQEGS